MSIPLRRHFRKGGGDDDVAEMEEALGRQNKPCSKALWRPSKAPTVEREAGKKRRLQEISDFKETVARTGGEREGRPVRKNDLVEPLGAKALKKPRSEAEPGLSRIRSADSGEFSEGLTTPGTNLDLPTTDHRARKDREKKRGEILRRMRSDDKENLTQDDRVPWWRWLARGLTTLSEDWKVHVRLDLLQKGETTEEVISTGRLNKIDRVQLRCVCLRLESKAQFQDW
eukprot:2570866-Amphidinium_carterae.2